MKGVQNMEYFMRLEWNCCRQSPWTLVLELLLVDQ